MTAKVDLLTAAPDVMKVWTGAALAIARERQPDGGAKPPGRSGDL
jgi:hypothetical protein